jgi:homoserine kinase
VKVLVEVPATSANLGAGFDCLALALDIWLRVEVETADDRRTSLVVHGEDSDSVRLSRRNRFMRGLDGGLNRLHAGRAPALRITMNNEIPLFRGLGSSAAATIAGLLVAQALAETELGTETLLALAAEIEGHADNSAAALLGGFVVVAGGHVVRFDPPTDLRAVLFIPERRLATADMRAVLPETVSHGDAVHNLGRAALIVAAMAGADLSLLSAMSDDRLHEPYRAKLYPEISALIAAAREAGALGAALSGAGSTVIALAVADSATGAIATALATAAAQLGLDGEARVVGLSRSGARVDPR